MARDDRSAAPRLTIGALSRRTGCKVETVRYYERVGLLPPPARSAGGHRIYTDEEAARLAFIRRSRALGFTLDQVRGLLGLVERGDYSCAEVRTIAQVHLAEVRARLKALAKMEAVLDVLVAQCEGGTTPDCAIMETLYQ